MLFPVIVVAIAFCFVLTRSIPGDVAVIMLGPEAAPEDYIRYRQHLGLDQPVYVQYVIYMERMLLGDWGQSIYYKEPVSGIVPLRFLNTLILALCSVAVGFVFGIIAGFVSVLKKGTIWDRLVTSASYFSLSMPVFWWGLLLQLVFAVNLRILPALGGGGLGLILPTLTLATWSFSGVSRITTGSMSDIMHEDYVNTARAKGLSEREILFRHVFRNALVPITTLTLVDLGRLLGGAFLTETVFNYPGLGALLVESIFRRDFPIIQAGLFFGVTCFVFINLFTDVLYVFLDPRIRYERKEVT